MTLSAAILDIQKKVAALEGIEAAPDSPTEGINVYPFSVCYAKSGQIEFASAGWGNYLHTLVCEIHLSRSMLAEAVECALPYIESFVQSLMADPRLGNTVSTTNQIRYLFGLLQWGDDNNIGVRFEIDVKITITT